MRASSNTTIATAPMPSTTQSALIPGCGSIVLAGPNSASGDATIARPTATTAPTAAVTPTSVSATTSSCARVIPVARNMGKSFVDRNSCRPTICPTMNSTARAVSNAKIASATACGRIARSIRATWSDSVEMKD